MLPIRYNRCNMLSLKHLICIVFSFIFIGSPKELLCSFNTASKLSYLLYLNEFIFFSSLFCKCEENNLFQMSYLLQWMCHRDMLKHTIEVQNVKYIKSIRGGVIRHGKHFPPSLNTKANWASL